MGGRRGARRRDASDTGLGSRPLRVRAGPGATLTAGDSISFTTVAMDMIVNHAAKLRFMSGGQTSVPLVIRTMTGAGDAPFKAPPQTP